MVVAVVVVVDGSKSSSGRIICLVRVVVIYGCIKSLRIPTGTDALLQTSCTMKVQHEKQDFIRQIFEGFPHPHSRRNLI